MQKKKFVVIGGGISGLSMAHFLNTDECVVLEKDDTPGGYCKTTISGDYTWDYAGHFFHFKTQELEALVLSKIPEQERVFNEKNTKILLKRKLIEYPFQTHIHQLEKADMVDCVVGMFLEESVSSDNFLSMLYKNYGSGIVDLFLKPYNEKLYACDLNKLDKDAMGRFFPAADKKQILRSMKGETQATYNDCFWYPKKGAQVMVDVLAHGARSMGAEIRLNEAVIKIDTKKQLVYTECDVYHYEHLINTMPLNRFWRILDSQWKEYPIVFSYNKVLVFNLGFSKGLGAESDYKGLHWMYVPEQNYNFYRVGFYNHILHEQKLSLYVEIGFDEKSDIDEERELERTLHGLREIGIVAPDNELVASQTIIMKPAYVHISTETNEQIKNLMQKLEKQSVYSVGRYGKWIYCSMEDCMLQARELAEKLKKR